MGKGRQELESQRTALANESDLLKKCLRRTEEQLQEAKSKSQGDGQKEGERRKLQADLAQVDDAHKKKMEELQENFRRQSQEMSSARNSYFSPPRASAKDSDRSPDWRLHESEAQSPSQLFPLVPPPDRLQEEADRGMGWRELHDREEQRALAVRGELQRCHAEMSELQATTAGELADVAEIRHELLEKQQAQDMVNEEKLAELRETECKSEKFLQAQDALEREAKDLQRQLSEAMYDVGKKDREQQLKEAELHEVRQSIHSIQDEMDLVNRQLQAQCGRVQRVESSLRLSRDLGSKVQSMRDMVMESHTALGQLCGLVEHERSQRGECSQGLRQQQMRTELLLQLLSHFKSRTQDLAPQALLSQATELAQGRVGSVLAEPATLLLSDPAMASSHSAMPPVHGMAAWSHE